MPGSWKPPCKLSQWRGSPTCSRTVVRETRRRESLCLTSIDTPEPTIAMNSKGLLAGMSNAEQNPMRNVAIWDVN